MLGTVDVEASCSGTILGRVWVHANVKGRCHTGERTDGYLSKNRHNVCKNVCPKTCARRRVPETTWCVNKRAGPANPSGGPPCA